MHAQMGVGNRLRLSIPWTAGAMILKYNDFIYIYTSIKNGNKKNMRNTNGGRKYMPL